MNRPESSHIIIIQQLNKQINIVLKEYEGAVLAGMHFSDLNEIKGRLTDLKRQRGEAYTASKQSAGKDK